MKFTLFSRLGWLAVAAGLSAGPTRAEDSQSVGSPPIHREELGSLPKGLTAGSLRVSPDGKRFAVVVVHGDKWTVWVDGVESPEYDAVTDNSIHFSPDSKRVAYGATRGGKGFAVVDGQEFPAGLACVMGFPIFDPTGERFLYVTAQPENRASVSVDGKEGETWEALAKGGPVFSPDGKHFLYVVKDGKGTRAVVDGIAGPAYENIVAPAFDPSGRHHAYVALTRDDSILVIDGKEMVKAENFVRDSFGFDSPDRLHILSIESRGKIARLQLDLSEPSPGKLP